VKLTAFETRFNHHRDGFPDDAGTAFWSYDIAGSAISLSTRKETLRMSPMTLTGRGLLLASVLVSGACSDLKDLARVPARAAADTAEPADLPPVSHTSEGSDSALDPVSAASNFGKIRSALRQLVKVEETFFAENGTYSDDLGHIGMRPDPNTRIRFLWISREGWAASGSHPELPGRDCVIFVGQAEAPPTTLKYVRSGREGVPVCDDSRSRAPRPRTAARASEPPPAKPDKPAPPAADTGSALDVLDPRVLMKVDLRNLAHSQATYLKMQGTYARRPETMALQYAWHRDVQVKILSADGESWAAKATHARFPGKSCVIWFGPVSQRPRTDAKQRTGDRTGVPVCDD
jgi:hypothetical protein